MLYEVITRHVRHRAACREVRQHHRALAVGHDVRDLRHEMDAAEHNEFGVRAGRHLRQLVITSYSIHYTKLYDSNARAVLEWSFARREKVLFFPDQHLGRNTAFEMGIPLEEMLVWDFTKPMGGATPEQIRAARITSYNVCYTKLLRTTCSSSIL